MVSVPGSYCATMKGQVIGRIAAFINDRLAKKESQPTGGCGFFECIHDQAAANLLFDNARDWLAARGMEAMDGPINFGLNGMPGETSSWKIRSATLQDELHPPGVYRDYLFGRTAFKKTSNNGAIH